MAILILQTGCSMMPEMTPFGAISGSDSTRSLNGLGLHRKMWESAGAKCYVAGKLSPRLNSFDTIVLVGQDHSPPGMAARNWLESWLAESSGRSVLYFGRDFDANVYYRNRTLDRLPTEQQLRAKQDLAKTQTADLNTRVRQLSASTFCRWFYLDTDSQRREYDQFAGPWAADLSGLRGSWPLGVTLQTPTKDWEAEKPSWLKAGASSEEQAEIEDEKSIVRSTWEPEELEDNRQWQAEFKKAMRPQVLLRGQDDTPLVFKLTSSRIEGSQILIAANGAPFLNGSLVDPLHQRVAEKLIGECLPAKKIALIAYNESGLLISQAAEEEPLGAGLEMLTVWPLSAITMPAALLGIIVCAVLFPILGRPRGLPPRSVTDFGMHVEALGNILQDTRDTGFAKEAIANYYNRVRREKPPFWLDQIETPVINRPVAPVVQANANAENAAPKANPSPAPTTGTGSSDAASGAASVGAASNTTGLPQETKSGAGSELTDRQASAPESPFVADETKSQPEPNSKETDKE